MLDGVTLSLTIQTRKSGAPLDSSPNLDAQVLVAVKHTSAQLNLLHLEMSDLFMVTHALVTSYLDDI